jgi:hypothetical protein
MDSDTGFISLVVGIVVVTMLVVWWQKTEPFSRTERRSRPVRQSQKSVPPMGRINVPCDPELLDEYVKALSGAHVQFMYPCIPEEPIAYPSRGHQNRCFILVAEEDCQRAEQIIAEVDRKFYL